MVDFLSKYSFARPATEAAQGYEYTVLTGPLTVGGVCAAVSKTACAPIERVKLLVQNQVRLLL